MLPYQTSEVFAQLKTIRERISSNYSSVQYVNVLDFLLYSAVEGIIETTDWMDGYFSDILAWYTTNSRRRISSVKKNRVLTYLMVFILSDNTKEKIQSLKLMRLERNLLFSAIYAWLEEVKNYRMAFLNNSKEALDIELRVKKKDSVFDFWSAISAVETWVAFASEFKSQIAEKYYRYALMEAQKLYLRLEHRISLEDLIQEMLLAVEKGIHKYDPEKGTLTPYIGNWIKSVNTNSWKTVIAKENNDTANFEEEDFFTGSSMEELLHDKQTQERVRALAKVADPDGFGRIYLNLLECSCK